MKRGNGGTPRGSGTAGYRVCMLTTSFPRFSGDHIGNFVYSLCRELAGMGLDVTVLAPHEEGAASREERDGIKARRFHYLYPASLQKVAYGSGTPANLRASWAARFGLPFFAFSYWLSASRLTRRCEIIHAHWIPSGLIGLTCLAVRRRPPVVVSVWGSDLGLIRSLWVGSLLRTVLRRASAILAVSQAMKRELVNLGLPPEKVMVVMSATDTVSRMAGDREQARSELGLPGGRPVALFMGRLAPVKGPQLLIEAAGRVIREFPEAYFVLLGDGQLREQLESSATGMRDNVRFAGFVPHHRVGQWLAAADLLVLPSLSEGMPHVIMEAMSMGLPVVASAVGGVPELVRHGENGLLVPPGDPAMLAESLTQLISSPDLRQRLGLGAARTVQERELSWERFAREVRDVYRAALQGNGA